MKKTDLTAQVIQMDGYWYERRVYTDGILKYIKVNGNFIDLCDLEKMNHIKSVETFYNPVGR